MQNKPAIILNLGAIGLLKFHQKRLIFEEFCTHKFTATAIMRLIGKLIGWRTVF